MKIVGVILFLLFFQNNYSQVGIGTTNPKQKLHIASSTGTLRVESLSSDYNSYNGGGTKNYPLYVDENGDFTLFFKPLINNEDLDAFNDLTLPNSTVTLSVDDIDGINSTVIATRDITVFRPSILELKYNISYDVYLNSSGEAITDGMARRIETYITVVGLIDPDPDISDGIRKYGPASKVYTSSSENSVTGTFYNSCTTYISLLAGLYPATFTIEFNGAVSSDVKAGFGGDPSRSTYVEFVVGNDFLFAKLH